MHRFRSLYLFILTCLSLLVEHHFGHIPLTLILIGFFLFDRLPLFLIGVISLIADVLLSFPFGTSAIICASLAFLVHHLPRSKILRWSLLGIVGVILGIVYGGSWVGTGILCLLLYTVGSGVPMVEEIGDGI